MRVLMAPFVMALVVWGLYALARPRKRNNG
jgi:hypothetical protein